MRTAFAMIFCIISLAAQCQTVTIFYDSSWNKTTPDKAFFYSVNVKNGTMFETDSYWSDSNRLYSKTFYYDTSSARNGSSLQYYRSGKIKDSILYDENGNAKSFNRYRENGSLELHAWFDNKDKYMKAEEYDEKGNKSPGFITFQKQAMFPGGLQGWIAYLQANLKADIPTRKRAPVGMYTVMVSFLVDKEGKISEVQAENDPGYGTAAEAVRVIKHGPDWIPAVQNNKKVIYRQRQPITFAVEEAKK